MYPPSLWLLLRSDTVKSGEDQILQEYSFDDSRVDWNNNNNIIITNGWKLKKISLTDFNLLRRNTSGLVKISLHKGQKNDKVYFYSIEKRDIFLDERYANGGVIFE